MTNPDFIKLEKPVMATVVRCIELTFCEVRQYRDNYLWTWTEFPDGSGYGATPDFSEEGEEEYRNLATRLGYDSVDEYCFVHEFCHSFIEQEIFGRPSPILWSLAHNLRHPDSTVYEESLVLAFQGYLHGGLPMKATAPGIDWERLRGKALNILDCADDPLRDPVAVALLR